MGKGAAGSRGNLQALSDRIVAENIVKNQIILIAEVSDKGYIAGMAADHYQAVLRAFPACDGLLQFLVNALLTGQEAAAAGGASIFQQSFSRSLIHLRVSGHGQIIVRAEVQDIPAFIERNVQQGRVMSYKIRVAEGFDNRRQASFSLGKSLIFARFLKRVYSARVFFPIWISGNPGSQFRSDLGFLFRIDKGCRCFCSSQSCVQDSCSGLFSTLVIAQEISYEGSCQFAAEVIVLDSNIIFILQGSYKRHGL